MKSKILILILLIQNFCFSKTNDIIFGKERIDYVFESLEDIKTNIKNKVFNLDEKIDTTYFSNDSILKVKFLSSENKINIQMNNYEDNFLYFTLSMNQNKKRFNIYHFGKFFDGEYNNKNEITHIRYYLDYYQNNTKYKKCSCSFNYKNNKHKKYGNCNILNVNEENIDEKAKSYKKHAYSLLIFN